MMNLLAHTTRWIARIGSVASVAVLSLFMFGGEEASPFSGLTLQEAMLFACFPIGIIIGMAVGWFRELAGATVTAAALAAFYAAHLVFGHAFPTGPWFVIFASPGLLFGLAWLFGRVSRSSNSAVPPGRSPQHRTA